jgi:hypothetical protein
MFEAAIFFASAAVALPGHALTEHGTRPVTINGPIQKNERVRRAVDHT